MQISDVFGAHPRSVWEYLCENGQGLYVPAYQRQYSWDKSKITRLIEDACHGFSMLIEHGDSITFLGTVIAIHDTQYLTVNPLVKGDVPSRVMTIIDGQQRLTTLLIIITVLHEEVKYRLGQLAVGDDPALEWLREECMKIAGRLAKTFEEDKDYGEAEFRYYPRMIRAYDDSWSRKKDKAEYSSPIGYYLHAYGQYGRGDAKTQFKFDPPKGHAEPAKYKLLSDGRKVVQSLVKAIAKNDQKTREQGLEIPEFSRILGSREFQDILVKADFPASVSDLITANDGANDFKELLRLVLFANFVLDRVALTIVTAKNEDYAFDMFEALNTTGEPLTAFETFKPRVIHCEGLDQYEKSDSHEYLKAVEGYLEGFGKTEDKQDATSRLIVAFAMAERGEKLSKRLSDQRRFFKEKFEKLGDGEPKREFVRHLSHAAIFVQHSWPDNKSTKPSVFSADEAATDEVILCLDLLRSFKHTITMGPLIRFYSEIRKADSNSRAAAVESFIAAIKAITAFSVLWRASRRGTDNIDTHYRRLMEVGHEAASGGMRPLARTCGDGTESSMSSVDAFKAALIAILSNEGKVGARDEWVKAAARIPAYSNQKEISRFLLLAAAHDSAADKNHPGLTVAGKQGLLPLLNYARWKDDDSQTVEHIAPKSRESGWLDEIYDDADTIDRLGNLTLLPRAENSSLSNGPWAKKKLFYKVLSAETSDELDPLLQQASLQEISISKDTKDLLAMSKHLPMVKSIANIEGEWSMDLIDKRSVRIAELAWDRIAPWLGLPI